MVKMSCNRTWGFQLAAITMWVNRDLLLPKQLIKLWGYINKVIVMKWFSIVLLYSVGPDNTCNTTSSLGCQEFGWDIAYQTMTDPGNGDPTNQKSWVFHLQKMEDFEVTWSSSLNIKKAVTCDFCYYRGKMKDQCSKVTGNCPFPTHEREYFFAVQTVKVEMDLPLLESWRFRNQLGRNVTEVKPWIALL